MKTPIYDFVTDYIASGTSRLHMPGHKGHGPLSIEQRDITEIEGADVLCEAQGIIGESEKNASELFGSSMTVYSTEGSSLGIRAMLYLALQRYKMRQMQNPHRRPVILAARNVHKGFLYSCAMLDLDVVWLYPEDTDLNSVCACHPTPEQVGAALRALPEPPAAVYLTSPDYLGAEADLAGIVSAVNAVCGTELMPENSQALSEVSADITADAAGSGKTTAAVTPRVPVIVDNAHGAYLHFLPVPRHPLDLGAYMCCDSAHKTLPVLTGGAYLHLSAAASAEVGALARSAVEMFGSTSPSYLILQSLDLCNRYLADPEYKKRLAATAGRMEGMKDYLETLGVRTIPSEPLKLVIDAAPRTGTELADLFRTHGMEPEFADQNYVVCMLTPENSFQDFLRIGELYRNVPEVWQSRLGCSRQPLNLIPLKSRISVREAVFAPQELIDVRESAGRICGQPTVSCPPAVPIAVSGEEISEDVIPVFLAYGIEKIAVVKE